MSRKHTTRRLGDLPDIILWPLYQVTVLKARTDEEIAGMKALALTPERAHHIMVEAILAGVTPASRLPKVIEAWESPTHEEFEPRMAWSLFNAFTEVLKAGPPRLQMEGSLRLTSLFRGSCPSTEPPKGPSNDGPAFLCEA